MRHSKLVEMIKSMAIERLLEADDTNKQVSNQTVNKVVAIKNPKKKSDVDKTPNQIVLNPTIDSIDQRR